MNSLFLGYDAAQRPIRLQPNDRTVHTHVIGSSGSGKSKLMEWLMRGDLKNGQGFCLIDPHGSLYDEVAEYCAHYVLEREVILLNLSVPGSVIGFNPFQRATDGDVSVQVDRRINATMHAWNVKDTDQTPTLARTLRLIYTVMLELNLGLPQVQHLIDFNAQRIRSHLVGQINSSLIQKEWRELQSLDAREWRKEVLSAKNKLFKFLTSQTFARFMGVPGRSIDLQEVMDKGKILLVNLAPSDYLSQDNGRTFGALLVNQFFECALRRRKDAQGRGPKPYYLYLDEFQNFVSLDIADMLDQVRKFGLFMVLAHQRFGQLDENLVDAVLTNCAIKAVFGGLSVPNARRMAEELFIGQLDPQRIKVAIYQTKFWPTYSRDKVYSKGSSHTSTAASTHSTGVGSFAGSVHGQSFMPTDWFSGSFFSGPTLTGTSDSSSLGSSSLYASADSQADTFGDTESVADIPILLPVPFEELSSVQYCTPEEQLIEVTAALKEQFPRHCFIKIGAEPTQPMLVPFVKKEYTSPENRQWYEQRVAKKQNALSAQDVDEIISAQEQNLLNNATFSASAEVEVVKRSSKRVKRKNSLHTPASVIQPRSIAQEIAFQMDKVKAQQREQKEKPARSSD